MVILANELLGACLQVNDVTCNGISSLDSAAIQQAQAAGQRWKLIGSASRETDGSVRACVEARLLPGNHPLAGISGATNAVAFNTELLGAVTVSGPGAGVSKRHSPCCLISSPSTLLAARPEEQPS